MLAAGQSRRFGANKLISRPAVNSEPLMIGAVRRTLAVPNEHFLLVTGKWHSDILQALNTYGLENITYVYNAQWQSGLSTSIRAGVAHLLANCTDVTHIMITLADLPRVDEESLGRLVEHSRLNEDAIVCSEFNNQKGVPAIFPVQYANALCNLTGDKGAKSIIASESAQKGRVISVNHSEAGIDIDTPEDWERYCSQSST